MCGIAGLWAQGGLAEDRLRALARAMAGTLAHRGPDDDGVWVDADAGIGLGHRRLAILDLSPAGHQPMASASGRYVISYNGEIYNAPELRAELEARGVRFRGTSDTEVMLEGLALWGLDATLDRLVGMFAFALWDRAERTLTLARDRLGKKPLYFLTRPGLTLFGSELKALLRHPDCPRDLDRAALAAYLRFAYVPSPLSIFAGIEKLAPGSLITLRADGSAVRRTYWDLAAIARSGGENERALDADDAADEAEGLIRLAVKQRMLSDVPLGAFLSGGVDSSLVVALMQAQSARPTRTFSIGFEEAGYNEANHARAVAAHLGTEHTEMTVTPADALAVAPLLPDWFDEPFADASQIPTYLVSALARPHVTVALSGDGGDEIAAGYVRHDAIARAWPSIARIPGAARRALAGGMRAAPVAAWDRLAQFAPASRRPAHAGDKMHKLATLVGAESADTLYRDLVSHWPAPERLVPGAREFAPPAADLARGIADPLRRAQYLDMATYLPDDVLCKVDRASMAVGLEARCPLLDQRVVTWFWRLPRPLLLGPGGGKLLLRRILARHVPPALTERPKMGFGVPIDRWLRGPLAPWAQDMLAPERLRRAGIFDPAPIAQALAEHMSGRRDHQHRLWTVLMFEAWRERWLEKPDAAAP